MPSDSTPLLHHPLTAPSVFRPEDLMQAVRADRGLATESVPALCVLDFDGDLSDGLIRDGIAIWQATFASTMTSAASGVVWRDAESTSAPRPRVRAE